MTNSMRKAINKHCEELRSQAAISARKRNVAEEMYAALKTIQNYAGNKRNGVEEAIYREAQAALDKADGKL